ncbi:MAG: hypothetical protein ABEH90_10465 [Halolamina sp.]
MTVTEPDTNGGDQPDPGADGIDTASLADALATFGGSETERRTVARQAADLAASGKYARDRSHPLTEAAVVDQLAEAREGSPAERWNWWMGALEAAYGGYEAFSVQRYPGSR